MCAPLGAQPLPLVLLDAMPGDLVQRHRAEHPVESRNDLAVTPHAPLVDFRVVAQVNLGELAERDVWLSADAVPPLQDAGSLPGFDIPSPMLVRGLRASSIATAVHMEVVVPHMVASRRRAAEQRT